MGISFELLKFAVDLELESNNYYRKKVEQSNDELAKLVFELLAMQELEHAETITRIADKGKIDLDGITFMNLDDEVDRIFEKINKNEEQVTKGNREIFEQALKLEDESAKTYIKLATDTNIEEELSFFKALLREEEKHKEFLERIISYFDDEENNNKNLTKKVEVY